MTDPESLKIHEAAALKFLAAFVTDAPDPASGEDSMAAFITYLDLTRAGLVCRKGEGAGQYFCLTPRGHTAVRELWKETSP